ncbi:DNA-directed RNA polymerase III subunit RPC4 [Plasmodiophora brassicae]
MADRAGSSGAGRLGSLSTASDRLRGRGRGRGLRKFAPTVAPRRAPAAAEPNASAVPKLLEVAQKPAVEGKEAARKRPERVAPKAKVAFVATETKKSSFVPNDRALRTTSSIVQTTPSGSPTHDDFDDMAIDGDIKPRVDDFAPTVLPFPFDAEPDRDSKVKREHTKETVASLVQRHHDGDGDGVMLWQLPRQLPVSTASQPNVKSEPGKSDHDPKEGVQNTPPSGLVGKLVVYASGRVMLRFGDVDFEVSRAADYPFRQEVVDVDLASKDCYRVGAIGSRIVTSVVVPDASGSTC